MNSGQQSLVWKTPRSSSQLRPGGLLADRLLAVVDGGIATTICAAPFVFGGRHDLGRLVFVAIVGITAITWFARQSLLPKAAWTRTSAYGLLLLISGLVGLQLTPLPLDWLARLSPRTFELLPLWTGGNAALQLGAWNTISLTPRETTLSLAMLVSYALFFTVLAQRLQTIADIEKLLDLIAIAAALMAGFGLLQFFFSNGKFFWFYVHPYRTTDQHAMGSFMNRNHFASFLVLGVAPIARWLVSLIRAQSASKSRHRVSMNTAALVGPILLLAVLGLVLLGILLSFSRGGAMALATATVTVGAVYWHWRLVDGKYLYGLAGIGLVMLGLLSIYGYEEVSGRLNDFASGSFEKLDRGEGRRKVWNANVAAIKSGWLVGSGAGSHSEICPVYLSEPTLKEFTHAENGYLQITTENGVVGAALLAAGIGLVAAWSFGCMRRLEEPRSQLCFGAAVAGLAASLVHSLVDFVWYIPACMSLTLALAVCTLRLAQFSLPKERQSAVAFAWSRPRWLECAAMATMLAGWTTYAFVGPGIAAIHWDRYLRDAVAGARVFEDQSLPMASELTASEAAMRGPLAESMQHHLEDALRWDPTFARAHLRLAARYVQRFELAQQNAENAMTLSQIRGAAEASSFASSQELHAWLDRAFGKNVELLKRAQAHARQSAILCPLQGDAYVFLAELGFLTGEKTPMSEACLAQAERVRPFDGDVTFQVGMQALLKGDLESAIAEWAKCYGGTGGHQIRIVNLLAGRIPASVFIERLQPDWQTLRAVWICYRQTNQPQELSQLLAYAAQVTQRDVNQKNGIAPAYLWLWQAAMFSDVDQQQLSLNCLEQAYQCDPHVYEVRRALAYALKQVGKYSEAEAHFRWCLARRPDDKNLVAALDDVARKRRLQQSTATPAAETGSLAGPR